MTSHGMSMLSDFGDEPLSSTRRSSSLNFSAVAGRPSWRGHNHLELSNLHGARDSLWEYEPPPVLSSTRMSVGGLPSLKEDVALSDGRGLQYEGTNHRHSEALPMPRPSALYSRRTSRKSVSFRDVDEYFPVFGTESSRQRPTQQSSESCDSTVDFTDYSEFFDTERMATVLHHQGIDVTSPDHVFVFSRDDVNVEEDFDKTVLGCWPTEQEKEDEVFTDSVSDQENKGQPPSTSGSSNSGSSKYSSCDSEEYKSAIGASLFKEASPVEDVHRSSLEGECNLACAPRQLQLKREMPCYDTDCVQPKTPSSGQAELSVVRTETDSQEFALEKATPVAEVTEMMRNLSCDRNFSNCEVFSPRGKDPPSEDCDLVVSPFVTGRTRSRLSRCSQRARVSQSSSSLSSSSLFEVTLPTPTRMRRTTRSQDSPGDLGHKAGEGYQASPYSGGRCAGTLNSIYSQNQAETLRVDQYSASCDGISQADTLILSDSMADTVILEKKTCEKFKDSFGITKGNTLSVEKNTLGLGREEVSSADEFITDDLSSSNDKGPNWGKGGLAASQTASQESNKDSMEDSWITDVESQTSSLASVDTPRKEPPDTPGTGCTPRYSMSRLSGHRRPQSLANLSYTPGGRPHLVDVDEPVEYLYTDVEGGHELIETHVPPTANSSNISSTTSDDTVLYDWRSFKKSPTKGKENVKPADDSLREFKGLTDKELRKKLVELGEAPGPITNRTRPVYMERLHRLQQENTSQPQSVQCNTGKHIHMSSLCYLKMSMDNALCLVIVIVSQKLNLCFPWSTIDYSPELRRAMHTFILPDSKDDEYVLCKQFDQPDQNKKWREGVIKSSFNYLLLDPR